MLWKGGIFNFTFIIKRLTMLLAPCALSSDCVFIHKCFGTQNQQDWRPGEIFRMLSNTNSRMEEAHYRYNQQIKSTSEPVTVMLIWDVWIMKCWYSLKSKTFWCLRHIFSCASFTIYLCIALVSTKWKVQGVKWNKSWLDLNQFVPVCWQVPRLRSVPVPSVGSIRTPSKELSSSINVTI